MIKTITNLTIKKWRDIYTNKIAAESLILEYIDESGKTNKTGCLTQSTELGYWSAATRIGTGTVRQDPQHQQAGRRDAHHTHDQSDRQRYGRQHARARPSNIRR